MLSLVFVRLAMSAHEQTFRRDPRPSKPVAADFPTSHEGMMRYLSVLYEHYRLEPGGATGEHLGYVKLANFLLKQWGGS